MPEPKALAAVLLVSILLAGCAGDSNQGAKSLNLGLPPGAGVSGALSGGLISGGALGNSLDEADRRQALEAEISALESGGPGYPVGWRSEAARGTVVAGPPYQRAGYQNCRDYSHTIYVGSRPLIARGAACRSAEGRWQAMT